MFGGTLYWSDLCAGLAPPSPVADGGGHAVDEPKGRGDYRWSFVLALLPVVVVAGRYWSPTLLNSALFCHAVAGHLC